MAIQEDTIETAERVVLSYPADLSKHGRFRVEQDYYKDYLRKTHDRLEEGDEWLEFTDIGCCGNQLEVPLVVESVEGGDALGEGTEIEYTERAACGINTGWSVQGDEPDPADWG